MSSDPTSWPRRSRKTTNPWPWPRPNRRARLLRSSRATSSRAPPSPTPSDKRACGTSARSTKRATGRRCCAIAIPTTKARRRPWLPTCSSTRSHSSHSEARRTPAVARPGRRLERRTDKHAGTKCRQVKTAGNAASRRVNPPDKKEETMRLRLRFNTALAAAATAVAVAGTIQAAGLAASWDALCKAGAQAKNWLSYGGDLGQQRYWPGTGINAENVGRLHVKWIFQTGVIGSFENTPIVENGVMYVTTPFDHVFAADARTGKELWHFQYKLGKNIFCCGPNNRGVAVYGDTVVFGTLDAHLVALTKKTGG